MNNALALTGSNFTLENAWNNFFCTISFCDKDFGSSNNQAAIPVSEATITINNEGYSPNNLSVKAGSQVTLNIINKGGGGCTQAFTLPKYNIQKVVPIGNSDKITFTAPNEPGTQLAFMCSMGMFRGTINVI
jgi:plastocyanin domain-containing protein